MPKKSAILNNVTEYSPEDLASYIQQGFVTLDELVNNTDGEFTAKMQLGVEKLLAGSEDEDFKKVMESASIADLQDFLNKYPMGTVAHLDAVRERKHVLEKIPASEPIVEESNGEEEEWFSIKNAGDIKLLEAFKEKYPNTSHLFELNKLITAEKNKEHSRKKSPIILKSMINKANSAEDVSKIIQVLLENKTITIGMLLELIRQDHNLLSSAACNDIISRGILNRNDLSKCGIDNGFINKMLTNARSQNFEPARPLQTIAEPCTEVYFWGIPFSGKTCALGAILSAAKNGLAARSMIPDNSCQGFGYMNRLSTIFSPGRICRLPGGTPVTSTYEMRFDLEDQEHKIHHVACIDLAGELFTCMFMKDAGEQMREDQKQALETLHNILLENRSNNRKIHFFVIEYGAEKRIYNGLPQAEYLNSAAAHLNSIGLFDSNTDAIYVLISKVDNASYEGSLEEHLLKYMTKNYLGFYNNLLLICKEHGINKGRVKIVPFSIGNVCFKDYCQFDATSATKMVDLLVRYSCFEKQGFWQKILSKFRL
jgi:hypothetical protein